MNTEEIKPLAPQTETTRGFPVVAFLDYYKNGCSLQASSLALIADPGQSAVWLGIDDPKPRIMAKDALRCGIATGKSTGWIDYPIHSAVVMNTRMHLERTQVESLVVHLQKWLETGQFE